MNYVLLGKKYGDFETGEASQRIILLFFFVIAALYIFVILMNMLVAIMQRTGKLLDCQHCCLFVVEVREASESP